MTKCLLHYRGFMGTNLQFIYWSVGFFWLSSAPAISSLKSCNIIGKSRPGQCTLCRACLPLAGMLRVVTLSGQTVGFQVLRTTPDSCCLVFIVLRQILITVQTGLTPIGLLFSLPSAAGSSMLPCWLLALSAGRYTDTFVRLLCERRLTPRLCLNLCKPLSQPLLMIGLYRLNLYLP